MYRLAFVVACTIAGCHRKSDGTPSNSNNSGSSDLSNRDSGSLGTGSSSEHHGGGHSDLPNENVGSKSVRKVGSSSVSSVDQDPYLPDAITGSTRTRKVNPNPVIAAAHFSPGSIPVRSHVAKSRVQIVAFGDFGSTTELMQKTMDTYHKKTANPDMVFLLGDNSYSKFSHATDYDIFFDYVARGSTAPHYPILGNYDFTLGVVPQLLDLSKIDSRWILPSTYHFKRFIETGFSICVWFIDTDHLEGTQAAWLEESLAAEKPACTWTIVNGHKPGAVQASGTTWNRNIAQIKTYL
jgi:hypothetical protein